MIYISDLSVRGLSYFYASCDGILELLYTRIPVRLVVGMCPITSGQCCDWSRSQSTCLPLCYFFYRDLWIVEVVGFADLQSRFLCQGYIPVTDGWILYGVVILLRYITLTFSPFWLFTVWFSLWICYLCITGTLLKWYASVCLNSFMCQQVVQQSLCQFATGYGPCVVWFSAL